jgi:hypothetical protein
VGLVVPQPLLQSEMPETVGMVEMLSRQASKPLSTTPRVIFGEVVEVVAVDLFIQHKIPH